MDRGAGSATVHRVAKSRTRLSEFASLHFTGKTMVLTIWTFVGRAISVYNMLSRFVIAFVPRNKWFFLFVCLFVCLFLFLISWLQSPSAVILEPRKINSVIVPIVSPGICHEVMGLVAMTLVF